MEGQDIRKMGTQNSKTIILKEIRPLEKKEPTNNRDLLQPEGRIFPRGLGPPAAAKPSVWCTETARMESGQSTSFLNS